ncbi:MAG: hypothetical protein ACLFUT_09510 [Desulfobacteraceae bacterium]
MGLLTGLPHKSRDRAVMTILSNQSAVTLIGLILPAQWDESGKVQGVKIATFDEGEYPILPDEMGQKLLGRLRQKILTQGYIVNDKHMPNCLKVTAFHRLEVS